MFGLPPCQRPHAALRGSLLGKPPTSRCSRSPVCRTRGWLATNARKSLGYDRPPQKPRSDGFVGIEPTKPTPSGFCGRQTTTTRPIRVSAAAREELRLPQGRQGCLRGRAALAFFEPAYDRGGRHTEGAPEPPKTRSFLVGAQDLLLALLGVAVGRRILPTLTTAGVTEVLLLGVVGSEAVLYDVGAAAMATGDCLGNHANTLTQLIHHSHLAHYPIL
jgi:hypothetical protein